MRFARDPIAAVLPSGRRIVRGDEPITASTAIAMFVRNEPPDRVIRNLDAMMRRARHRRRRRPFPSLCAERHQPERHRGARRNRLRRARRAMARPYSGDLPPAQHQHRLQGRQFLGFLRALGRRARIRGDARHRQLHDRRRRSCAWSRVMQADPTLGILQGLVVGLPSTSAFARIFQFGMRLGMRSWTIGSAWWQADCGPYWGHNAVIRIAPFIAHCHIPPLPGDGVLGGDVLSHDQIEAALMRRAGYDVRVLPEEDLGWEENPPTLIEFIRRDQRWCQGTLQYGPFLIEPGPEVRQPLPARFRHADVPGLAGLDRAAGGRHAGAGGLARRRRLHPTRRRHGAARRHPGHVVRAEDRDRDRRADAAGAPPRLRRQPRASWPASSPRRCSSSCCRRSCGSATRCSSPACRSAASSAGSARCATITPFRGRRRSTSCGRTPRSGRRRLATPRRHRSRPRCPTRSCSPAGPRCRSRSAVVTAHGRRSAAR